MKNEIFCVPDGLEDLKQSMSTIIDLMARTARWVHPDTFRALPVWYPETARGQPIYDANWGSVYRNRNRSTTKVTEKSEPNIKAGKAFVAGLGTRKAPNWTVCHIWGVDDPKFQRSNGVVRDPKFYSCIGNMVWLPTPLKGFTDAVPEVKRMLRTCAFYLYDWACEHPDVQEQAKEVRSGVVPEGYPTVWPAPGRRVLPPGTAPFSPRVAQAIAIRKEQLRRMLNDRRLTNFPRKQAKDVLKFWKIQL
jgi:hypothetical protein